MRWFYSGLVAIAILAISGNAAQAGFVIDLAAELQAEDNGVLGIQVGEWIQVGVVSGNPNNNANNYPAAEFLSYQADPPLPGADPTQLFNFGMVIDGEVTSVDLVNRAVSYAGTWWILAPGFGLTDTDSQYLERGDFNFTALFDEAWQTAAITGPMIAEVGPRQPAGWPEPVDWSAGNPAEFSGHWAAATNQLTGTITGPVQAPIPEPSTLILAAGSSLFLALALRRGTKR